MDSEDISLSDRLKTQYNFLEKNPEIFLVGGGAIDIDKDGIGTIAYKVIDDELKLKERLQRNNAIFHSTIMFRNEKNYLYREKFIYSQDYDLYLMLLSKGKRLINISDILIKYRIVSDAISWSVSAKQKLFAIKAKEFYYQRLKYGKDEYDKFNPCDILDLDIEGSTDKFILQFEVLASFKKNDLKNNGVNPSS